MLLISSLIVAAIPVDSFEGGTAQAEPLGSSTLFPGNFANADANYISEAESLVPKIDTNETVYTTGDGLFQYAYVYKKGQNSDTFNLPENIRPIALLPIGYAADGIQPAPLHTAYREYAATITEL